MDEAGLLALALEGDILAHVEPPSVEVEAAHRVHQRIEQERPLVARHRESADIDVRRLGPAASAARPARRGDDCSCARRSARTAHARPRSSSSRLAEHPVIGGVKVDASARRAPARAARARLRAPSIAPAFHRPPRPSPRLRSNSKRDRCAMTWVGTSRIRLAGERILLAQPIGVGQLHRRATSARSPCPSWMAVATTGPAPRWTVHHRLSSGFSSSLMGR